MAVLTEQQILGDPDFVGLPPAEKAKVLARVRAGATAAGGTRRAGTAQFPQSSPGTTTTTTSNAPGMMDKLLTMIGVNPQEITGAGVATGAAKTIGGMVANAPLAPFVGAPTLGGVIDMAGRAMSPGATSTVAQTMTPQGPSEKLGNTAANIAQVAIPVGGAVAGGVRGMMAARAGGAAARAAAMAAASESGAASEEMLGKVADLGSVASKLKRAAIDKAGSMLQANEELAAAHEELAAARAKGAVPGHGMIPKTLVDKAQAAEEAAKAAMDEHSVVSQQVRSVLDQLDEAKAASVKLKLRADALSKAQAATTKGDKGGITSAMLKSVLGAGMHGTAWEIGRELIRAIGGAR